MANETREVLAQNLNRMMESRYKNVGNRPLALAKDADVSLSTVQRTLSRGTGTTIDVIDAFARVFGIPVYQMLVPWGLLGEIAVSPAAGPSAVDARRKPLFRGAAAVRRDNAVSARKRRRAE